MKDKEYDDLINNIKDNRIIHKLNTCMRNNEVFDINDLSENQLINLRAYLTEMDKQNTSKYNQIIEYILKCSKDKNIVDKNMKKWLKK